VIRVRKFQVARIDYDTGQPLTCTEVAEPLPANDEPMFLKAMTKPERLAVLAVFVVLFATVTGLKIIRIDELKGDSAIFFQLVENIATRGLPVSQVFANTQAFLESGHLTEGAAQLARDPLAPPFLVERNMLHFHAYFVLFPIAGLFKIVPSHAILFSLYVLSYLGVLFFAYSALRSRNVSIIGTCLFCILVVSHPAWSDSLLLGQFYPDRLFILLGFILMYLTSRKTTPRIVLFVASLACAIINERAALISGFFLIGYVALYWQQNVRERYVKLLLGLMLLAYGLFVMKVVLANVNYSMFMPTSIDQLSSNLRDAVFLHKTELFLLINLPFLVIAIFDVRAIALALMVMLPNLIGSIGGAEKIGWATPYHSYYLPVLIWASLMGYVRAYRMATTHARRLAFYFVTAVLMLVLNMINPYSFEDISVLPANLTYHFVVDFARQTSSYFTPAGFALRSEADRLRAAVPEYSTVSTTESGMALLYRSRTIRVFPIDIEHADFVVIPVIRETNGGLVSLGTPSFLPPPEQRKINGVIANRLMKSGYDLSHPILVSALGLSVFKRAR
jgi:hypothetical protein